MADLFQIGLSGVYSSQANLATTSNNIANINTEGYSRQHVDIDSADAGKYGSYFIGNGSMISGIDRAYDQFAYTENLMNTSQLGYSEEVYQQTSQLDSLLSSSGTSVAQPVLEMFDSLHDVADSPNTLETREVFLQEANKMASQYNVLYDSLQTQYSAINGDIENTAESVSGLADNIASLNDRISKLGAKEGQNANGLLDKRDQALTELSQYVDVSVVNGNNNMVNVFIGSGQSLVVGNAALEMVATNGDPDPTRKELALSLNNNQTPIDGSRLGGTLSALFDTRNNDLESAMNQIGQNVIGLTHSINEQQAAGTTLDGEVGGDIFNDVNAIESMQKRVLSHDDGLGTALLSVSIDDVSALTADEYQVVVDDYTAAAVGPPAVDESISFTTTNLTTGATETFSGKSVAERVDIPNSGVSLAFDTISADDPLQSGKTFSLRPTRVAAQEVSVTETDPAKIAAAGPEVQTVASATNSGDAVMRTSAITNSSDSLYVDADNPLQIIAVEDDATGEITYNVMNKNGAIVTDSNGTKQEGLTPATNAETGKATLSVAGVEVELVSGTVSADDTFMLNYNETGVGDNSNILAIADLQNQKIMDEGKSTIADVYSGLLSEVGAKASNAEISKQTMEVLQSQSFERIQNVSGVNMDEEAANLLQYQQYYSASARVITIATELFDTILQIR